MMRVNILYIVIAMMGCNSNRPHFCETNDCSIGSDNSSLGRIIKADKFVDLLDTTRVLSDHTSASFEIDFSTNALHLFAWLEEDDIQYTYTTRDTCIWKDPCIEFFFDPGADGIDYYELQFNAYPQVSDLKLKGARGPINAPENMIPWDIGDNYGLHKRMGTANDASDVDQLWTLVADIPWDKICEGKPKHGDVWAYNFMRVDYDENDNPTYWVAYPTGKEMIHHPETWPTYTF